jgi:hypothetical protein
MILSILGGNYFIENPFQPTEVVAVAVVAVAVVAVSEFTQNHPGIHLNSSNLL